MSTCPVCTAPQPEGLLCHNDTTRLEVALGQVPWLVEQLAVTISKQAKIGAGASGSAPARERNPLNFGALTIADELGDVLHAWAVEVGGRGSSIMAAQRDLLRNIPNARKHPKVGDLLDEVTDAVHRAIQAVDRPADRQFVGPCLAPTPDDQGRDVTCLADIWAKPAASTATCRTCGITHDVAERRMWMLREADDRLFTVREAAQLIGSHGDLRVSESTIRGYVHAGKLAYHGKVSGQSVVRLGDLLDVVNDHSRKKSGQKLRAVSAA
jgi:hypothetical protein